MCYAQRSRKAMSRLRLQGKEKRDGAQAPSR
jgi:hypothetical protein